MPIAAAAAWPLPPACMVSIPSVRRGCCRRKKMAGPIISPDAGFWSTSYVGRKSGVIPTLCSRLHLALRSAVAVGSLCKRSVN